MKKLFLLILATLCLSACSTPNTTSVISAQNNDLQQELAQSGAAPTAVAPADTANALAAAYDQVDIRTNFGTIGVQLYGADSPNTVENFLKLAQSKFYDGTLFHRVVLGTLIQGGDPNSRSSNWETHGLGGPGYFIKDEFNSHLFVKGSVGMANNGQPNTGGSQFFILTADSAPWMDGKYTNFGTVIRGLDVVTQIENVAVNQNDHPLQDVVILGIDLIKKQ